MVSDASESGLVHVVSKYLPVLAPVNLPKLDQQEQHSRNTRAVFGLLTKPQDYGIGPAVAPVFKALLGVFSTKLTHENLAGIPGIVGLDKPSGPSSIETISFAANELSQRLFDLKPEMLGMQQLYNLLCVQMVCRFIALGGAYFEQASQITIESYFSDLRYMISLIAAPTATQTPDQSLSLITSPEEGLKYIQSWVKLKHGPGDEGSLPPARLLTRFIDWYAKSDSAPSSG